MIEFFFDTEEVDFEKLQVIEPVVEKILSDYGYTMKYENIILMSDEELLEINREFMKHDYFTDIITFNYSEVPKNVEAELYISWDRVKENANDHNVNDLDELYRVIIHGTLHLVGFEDSTLELKSEMQLLENQYINIIVPRETLK